MLIQHFLAQQCTREHGEGRQRTRAPAAACFRVPVAAVCPRKLLSRHNRLFFCLTGASCLGRFGVCVHVCVCVCLYVCVFVIVCAFVGWCCLDP